MPKHGPRSSTVGEELAVDAVEQADEADERPRFGPTGHGAAALRVLATLRAPDARSLSAGVRRGQGDQMLNRSVVIVVSYGRNATGRVV